MEGLGARDGVQLVRFVREIERVTPMTSTKAAVTEAGGSLAARGGTALCDALLLPVELAAGRRGRKAIVVLSDGVNDDGTGRPGEAMLDDLLRRAAEVNVPILVVGLSSCDWAASSTRRS